jgi:hypothetical protein
MTESRGDKVTRPKSRTTQLRGTKSCCPKFSPSQNLAEPKILREKISQQRYHAGYKITRQQNLEIEYLAIQKSRQKQSSVGSIKHS